MPVLLNYKYQDNVLYSVWPSSTGVISLLLLLQHIDYKTKKYASSTLTYLVTFIMCLKK